MVPFSTIFILIERLSKQFGGGSIALTCTQFRLYFTIVVLKLYGKIAEFMFYFMLTQKL